MWTYSGDPTDSAKDEVRFLIGDTDSSSQLISDEEVNYLVGIYPASAGTANFLAAAAAARSIAARYTGAVSKQVGSLRINLAERASQYAELAKTLEEAATTGAGQVIGAPILGGGGRTYLMEREWFDDHSP